MTTFISSFASFLTSQTHKVRRMFALLITAPLLLASAASGRSVGADNVATAPKPAQQLTSAKAPIAARTQPLVSLRSAMFANFERATRGISGPRVAIAEMTGETSAGIGCSPSRVSKFAPVFQITLPKRFADRRTRFVAITPKGNLHIIYLAYGHGVETVDIIIPSRTIDWERARTRNVFRVDARRFDALRLGATKPSLLFREAGVYQFALVNGIDRSLLEVNGTPFRLIAGCLVHWQP
jgi:hypothetical protein